MSIVSTVATYQARIPDAQDKSGNIKHALKATCDVCQEQLDWLVRHVEAECVYLSQFDGTSKRLTAAEKLFHATNKILIPNISSMMRNTGIRLRISAGRSLERPSGMSHLTIRIWNVG